MTDNQRLKETLQEEMKRRGVKFPRLSKETGIPKDRMYKWYGEQGSRISHQDVVTLQRWLDRKMDNNTNLERNRTTMEGAATHGQEGESPENKIPGQVGRDGEAKSLQAILSLSETNRKAIDAVDKIADSNLILARLLEQKATEPRPQEIPEALTEGMLQVLEYLAKIGSGTLRWKSEAEGRAELNKIVGVTAPRHSASSVHSSQGQDKQGISH